MRLTVVVLHNLGQGMFWKFDPEVAELYHAHNFEVEADNADMAAQLVWTLGNQESPEALRVGNPSLSRYAEQVAAYRARMNRSLSVGDVILIYEGERPVAAKAVAMLGFDDLIAEPTFVGITSNDGEQSAAYEAHLQVLRTQRTPGGRALRL